MRREQEESGVIQRYSSGWQSKQVEDEPDSEIHGNVGVGSRGGDCYNPSWDC